MGCCALGVSPVARGEGYGTSEGFGPGNSVLRSITHVDANSNFIAVGRAWNGHEYTGLLASYLKSNGGHDVNFGVGNGLFGKELLDVSGSGLETTCMGVIAVGANYVAACRSMRSVSYYETYLVKFDNSGALVGAFGSNGIVTTGIGTTGVSTYRHAMPRGLVLDTSTNEIAVVGRVSNGGSWNPYIAAFDKDTGAQSGSTVTTSLSGTAVAVTYDATAGYYYLAASETSGSRSYHLYRFDDSLSASSSPWGDALDLTTAGGGTDSLAAGIVADTGTRVLIFGGNRASSSTPPWRCAIAAVSESSGGLDTTWGRNYLYGATSGNQSQGVTLFSHDTPAGTESDDCLLNAAALDSGPTNLHAVGSAYNGTNYDYLAATVSVSSGAVVSASFDTAGSGDDVVTAVALSGSDFIQVGRSLSGSYSGAAVAKRKVADAWSATSTTSAPSARSSHTAVWTGSQVVVWGGCNASSYFSDGARYDPVADSWSATSSTSAPTGRCGHTAVWTGSKMVVWGGTPDGSSVLNSGSRYDPVGDSWSATATSGAAAARTLHTAVWTGSKMVVWGGASSSSANLNSGGRYDPSANTWSTLNTSGAPPARIYHTAVWSGTKMIAWGGQSTGYGAGGAPTVLSDGGRYDPSGDSWSSTASTSLAGRIRHTAVWTGAKMIVWGGTDGNGTSYDDGGLYDLSGDSWSAVTTGSAPAARYRHVAVWTGTHMLVWGGYDDSSYYSTGSAYAPLEDSWTALTNTGALAQRASPAAVWTGATMFVWGGYDGGGYLATGSRYSPGSVNTRRSSDVWTATNTGSAPSARAYHAAAWTGSEMVVFGGFLGGTSYTNSGGKYDPVADSWASMATSGAPTARAYLPAVWTGSKVLVWGGYDGSSYLTDGGQYDPSGNSWSGITSSSAPAGRKLHSALWTGSKMVVWGGLGPSALNSGGRYDPGGDSWLSTTTTGAPSARVGNSAVWTGTRMIVWGGGNGSGTFYADGSSYDPSGNAWTALSSTGAPAARAYHSAVYGAYRMIVWGGGDDLTPTWVNTGGVYSPILDTWSSTTTTSAPAARGKHNAVWYGGLMIVWGDNGGGSCDGGRYDPDADAWSTMSTTNAPNLLNSFSFVWTGTSFLIWGGYDTSSALSDAGGVYSP